MIKEEPSYIHYGHQCIEQDDVDAVMTALKSDWLTQGPLVELFEQGFANYCGAKYAVAVSSGSAALHLATLAAGLSSGDEAITSPLTFVATANAIVHAGGTPVFADVDPSDCCLDCEQVESVVSSRTRVVIPVHFSGHPCDMTAFADLAERKQLVVIEDAAHAMGATYSVDGQSYRVGECAHSDMAIFSFHPVKHITTAEGGMITTNSADIYRQLLKLRNNGITRDRSEVLQDEGPWYYEMQSLGFNYRLSDLQCALGLSQLKKMNQFLMRRKQIVVQYQSAFGRDQELILPIEKDTVSSSWHLFTVQLRTCDRAKVFEKLRKEGIGVNVHYIPVPRQPFYKKMLGELRQQSWPHADAYYRRALTLPLHSGLADEEIEKVVNTLRDVIKELKP